MMIFQGVDSMGAPGRYYAEGEFFAELQPDFCGSWAPTAEAPNVDYASLYVEGQGLDEVCPAHIRNKWIGARTRLSAYLKALRTAQVRWEDRGLLGVVPEKDIRVFLDTKSEICRHVLETYTKPPNYDFLYSLSLLLSRIRSQTLRVDASQLTHHLHKTSARHLSKRLSKISPHIKYNMFKGKTGRLTTDPDSFPILTLAKEYRNVLSPVNDCFVEIDYNAAELRTLLALSGLEQPTEDLHGWNIENVFRGLGTREEAKRRVFAWLYNPSAKDYLLDRVYDRASVVKKYFTGEEVTTFFDRTISCDSHHALNYIIQSTTSDLFLRQALKVEQYVEKQLEKTFISFLVHDSIVLDVCREDLYALKEIQEIFACTDLGKFRTNASYGQKYGEMRELSL